MKRIGVLTSGGDAPGMNAAIRAVVRTSLSNDMSVVGFKRGYNGVLMRSLDQIDDYQMMTSRSVSDKIHRGGTFLMTARCLEFVQPEVQEKAVKNLKTLGVEGLICIGGDGTFQGANALNMKGLPTIGIPGTIDNDLDYTDFTIGFDTALNTACESINRIRETSDSHERASMVTVMGRNCGDIALHTALACGAEIVLIPEREWTVEEVADHMKWGVMKGKRSMIMIIAEGAIASLTSDVHKICAEHESLSDIVGTRLDTNQVARIVEVLSGQETRNTVLGYTQRGGSPTASDRVLASRLGARAVDLMRQDKSGVAVGIRKNKLIEVPIDEARGGRKADRELLKLVDVLS
ncbi:6-phosphofructokinase [Eubacteriales bacterium OttesenSCG-928-N13]|nr:6-phosphofructokinase [Eubacteriales bacterium OttesenSCG-928-N13]